MPKLLSWCFAADSEAQLIFPRLFSYFYVLHNGALIHRNLFIYPRIWAKLWSPNSVFPQAKWPLWLATWMRFDRTVCSRLDSWGLHLITTGFLVFLLEYWLSVRNSRLCCSWRTNCSGLTIYPSFYWWGQYEPMFLPHAWRPLVGTLGPGILSYSPPSLSVLRQDRYGGCPQAACWERPDMGMGMYLLCLPMALAWYVCCGGGTAGLWGTGATPAAMYIFQGCSWLV